MATMDEFSIDQVLAEVAVLVKPHFGKGRPADYIPQLATQNDDVILPKYSK